MSAWCSRLSDKYHISPPFSTLGHRCKRAQLAFLCFNWLCPLPSCASLGSSVNKIDLGFKSLYGEWKCSTPFKIWKEYLSKVHCDPGLPSLTSTGHFYFIISIMDFFHICRDVSWHTFSDYIKIRKVYYTEAKPKLTLHGIANIWFFSMHAWCSLCQSSWCRHYRSPGSFRMCFLPAAPSITQRHPVNEGLSGT